MLGVITAPTNVRNYPSKGIGDRLGGLLYNQRVNVIARNDRANWLYILFSESPTGAGWVTAKAIQLNGDLTRLPIALYASPEGVPTLYPPVLFDAPTAPLPINTPAPGVRMLKVNDLAYMRVCPSVGCMTLGTLPGGTLLTITGQADEKAWLQFEYPSGPNARAWIATSLVTILDGLGGAPEFDLLGNPLTPAAPETLATLPPATVSASATPAAPTGSVTAQINVRSGPASSFDSLGLLNAKDTVILTGLTLNGLWYQIQYAAAPGGFGWVASSYITLNSDSSTLPYFDNQGNPLPKP